MKGVDGWGSEELLTAVSRWWSLKFSSQSNSRDTFFFQREFCKFYKSGQSVLNTGHSRFMGYLDSWGFISQISFIINGKVAGDINPNKSEHGFSIHKPCKINPQNP